MVATAPQVDRLFILEWVQYQKSAEYTNAHNNTCMWARTMTGHVSPYNAVKQTSSYCLFALIGLKALLIILMITNASRMTTMSDCHSWIKRKWAQKPITPTTSHATFSLQMVHSDRCSPLATAIKRGQYRQCPMDHATSHSDEYKMKYQLEALEEFKE